MDVEQKVREYIDKTIHLSLGTTKNGNPWVCEVHFAYDDDLNLYFRSLASRRHSQEIQQNSNVAGNIVDKHDINEPPIGIYFEGAAELLSSNEEQIIAARHLTRRLKIDTDIVEEAKRADGHQFYKITVENWYVFGRFGADHGQKFKLEWNTL